MNALKIDERLKEWATATQIKYIDAINEHGSAKAAARALGVHHSTVCYAVEASKKKAALNGYSPDHHLTRPLAPGLKMRGTSQLFRRGEPEPVLEWVKTSLDESQAEEIIREFVRHLVEDARGTSPFIEPPGYVDEDLLAVIPMGDPHFGMYAWAKEAGADFDLATAEKLTCKAIDRLVATAPNAATCLLLNLGDFFHADNSSNTTPGAGNALDVDTRYAHVMQVGLRAMVYCIKRLLGKHEKVIVWIMAGNHDPHSSFALALCVSAFFENEPRVEVDMSPSLFKYMRFGKVLLGAHHGHTAKMSELSGIMACDRPQDWGLTQYRYWYCGHIHHKVKTETTGKEDLGATVETFRTLAPGDAWHAGKGYRAGRDMSVITHHREYGEIQRTRCDVAMLK